MRIKKRNKISLKGHSGGKCYPASVNSRILKRLSQRDIAMDERDREFA